MLAEWSVAPDYIVANWTEELLELMLEKLIERKKRETAAIRGRSYEPETTDRVVSDAQMFNMLGVEVKRNVN